MFYRPNCPQIYIFTYYKILFLNKNLSFTLSIYGLYKTFKKTYESKTLSFEQLHSKTQKKVFDQLIA